MTDQTFKKGRNLLGLLLFATCLAVFIAGLAVFARAAEDTQCAEVKIEISQELTLERQAFDAHMRINNGLSHVALADVAVEVAFSDDQGNAVQASSDPDHPDALFFIRIDSMANIDDVSGSGTVAPSTSADIHWLIIPATGASNGLESGTLYYVGAALTYTVGGEENVTTVSPDYIYVKPMPELQLDYFLTRDVIGDDAFTTEIEPSEPFSLGVRVKNNGHGVAHDLTVESAQPKITENDQGLLIGFMIESSEVNGEPATESLLADFGDLAPNSSGVARWSMTCTLSGRFDGFSADFAHADELGGQLTSLIQGTPATHELIRDVWVDLPGRDEIEDFLADDGATVMVYESDGTDTAVTDQSIPATLHFIQNNGSQSQYRLTVPQTAGFMWVRLADPFAGQKIMAGAVRSDGKQIKSQNAWLSKSRQPGSSDWDHFVNLFDTNTTTGYTLVWEDSTTRPQAPVLGFVADRGVRETQQLSFVVEASDPNDTVPAISADYLPAGAELIDRVDGTAIFDWIPSIGQQGEYAIVFKASDGALETTQRARMVVFAVGDTDMDGMDDDWELAHFGSLDRDGSGDFDGDDISDLDEFISGTDPGLSESAPEEPQPLSPLEQEVVTDATPDLVVANSYDNENDPVSYEFEIYADEQMTDRVAAGDNVPENANTRVFSGVYLADNGGGAGAPPATTSWSPAAGLADNTRYFWRSRADDGKGISFWGYSQFFLSLQNDPPQDFDVADPAEGATVDTLQPMLQVVNSADIDNDSLIYRFEVYDDAALTQLLWAADVDEGSEGTTETVVAVALGDGRQYFWRVTADDRNGGTAETAVNSFWIDTANHAPETPVIIAPTVGAEIDQATVMLTVGNVTDADGDVLTYRFELDRVNTFNSADKQVSGEIGQGAVDTGWQVNGLQENIRYYWRVKAFDGQTAGRWTAGNFFVNTINDAAAVPTVKNPGREAWVDALTPTLELIATVDPDGDDLVYEFEVYTNANFTRFAAQGESALHRWIVPQTLNNRSWYYWRARAVDEHGFPGAWTQTARFYTNADLLNTPPQITLLEPAAPVITNGDSVQIQWDDGDVDSDARIAIYFDDDDQGADGTLITDGLWEDPEGADDIYTWDVSSIEGTFYIYAVISDFESSRISYAPAAVTIDRTPPEVTVEPPGGTYPSAQTVEVTTDETASIYYTLDGSEPTTGSDLYSVPIVIDTALTLRILAVDPAGNAAVEVNESYTFNSAPTISGSPLTSVDEDTFYEFIPVAADADPGDALLLSILNQPAWAQFDPQTGTLSGTPGNDDVGVTTGIVITVSDPAGAEASLTPFDLTVVPVNDPPLAVADAYATNEDTPLTIDAPGVLANDTDVDSIDLSAVLVQDVSHGALSLLADGGFSYQPAPDFAGSDSFTYRATDGELNSGAVEVSLTIHPDNDAPWITIVEPAQPVLTRDNTVLIQWTDGDPDNDAVIALYHDSDGQGADGVLIADDISEDADGAGDTYSWDVSGTEGTFYIYALITDGTFSQTVYAPATITVDRTPPALTIQPAGGFITAPTAVVLETDEPAAIYYTRDGSQPTPEATLYINPVLIEVDTTLRALAVDEAGNVSGVSGETYLMDSDGDQLPDSWELDHFGHLDRDGSGDADGDGISDRDEYLNGTDPSLSNAPTAPAVAWPADQSEVMDRQPVLEVYNSSDPDTDPITYTFELYADPELTVLVFAAEGVAQGTDTTAWSVPQPLVDNTPYWWRIRATDGLGYSLWTHAEFFINTTNDPPLAFNISHPQDGAEVDTRTPLLEVTNSSDPDRDTITYGFEVYADDALTIPVASADQIAQGGNGTTAWLIGTLLDDNTWYFWKAVATDEHGSTTETQMAAVFINTINDAPEAPAILDPLIGEEVDQQDLTLTVTNAYDLDEDILSYSFELDQVNTFDSPALMVSDLIPEGTDQTGWAVSALADNQTWYWRAKADDGYAESPWNLGDFFVNTINDPPSVPGLRNPGQGAWVDTLTPALELHPATDLDHDPLTYRFELFDDADLTNPVAAAETSDPQWVVPAPLQDNVWYWWRARAVDEHGATSAWMETALYFTDSNGVDDPPTIAITTPAQETWTNTDSLLIGWQDADPDSNAEIALFYDTQPGSGSGVIIAELLEEDADGDQDTFAWDISQLPDGTYFVSARISDAVSTAYTEGPAAVHIDRTPPPAVVADPPGGYYEEAQQVVLSVADNAEIYYTLDGSNPDANASRYQTPVTIAETVTLKTIAIDAAGNQSPVGTEVYEISDLPGDLDHDGDVDRKDKRILLRAMGSREGHPRFVPEADYNQDGRITGKDLKQWLKYYLDYKLSRYCDRALNGDLDDDGDVDWRDRRLFKRAFRTCEGHDRYLPAADYNGDGCITSKDYRKWRGYFYDYKRCKRLNRRH